MVWKWNYCNLKGLITMRSHHQKEVSFFFQLKGKDSCHNVTKSKISISHSLFSFALSLCIVFTNRRNLADTLFLSHACNILLPATHKHSLLGSGTHTHILFLSHTDTSFLAHTQNILTNWFTFTHINTPTLAAMHCQPCTDTHMCTPTHTHAHPLTNTHTRSVSLTL